MGTGRRSGGRWGRGPGASWRVCGRVVTGWPRRDRGCAGARVLAASQMVLSDRRSGLIAGSVTASGGAGHAQNGGWGHQGMPKTRHVERPRPDGEV